ncbi:MAG: serine hydrolase [Bacteroidales bacterium]|nr:serine hydrolase [Bacteroidales bacterium]
MNFRKVITKKYVWIPLIVLSIGGLILLGITLFSSKTPKAPDGFAAFYNYPSQEIDSIVSLMKEPQKAEYLIMLTNYDKKEFEENKSNFYGTFLLNLVNDSADIVLSDFLSLKHSINAVSENVLTSYSSDSILFANPNLIETISDIEFKSKYNAYIIHNLKKFNVNALVIDYKIPKKTDTTSQKWIQQHFLIKLKSLHQNNILSFISIDTIPEFADENTKKIIKQSLQELADSGLCGIIFKKSENINFIQDINFDGLKVLNSGNTTPTKNDLQKYDVFLINSSQVNKVEIINKIVDLKEKESLYIKTSKVLRAGYWANDNKQTVDTTIFFPKISLLESNLIENSITVLRNENDLLPLKDIRTKLHIIIASSEPHPEFLEMLSNYAENYTFAYYDFNSTKHPYIPSTAGSVVFIMESDSYQDSASNKINSIFEQFNGNLIVLNMGEMPIDIAEIKSTSLVQIYSTNQIAYKFAAQLIWGGIGSGGKLSSYINDTLKTGSGIVTSKVRLKYSIPEDVSLNSDTLKKIDSIINYALSTGVMPGCQVFIAKNGVVVYDKAFGHHDYSRQNPVKTHDLYDIASLTKICGTTLAMMKMVEQGKIRLDDPLEKYFEDTDIDYSNIKPDTVIFIDTISIFNKTEKEIEKLVENKDTIHINDTLVELTEIVITRLTPSLNIFKVTPRDLLVHQSGVSPSLPILPYMFYMDSYGELLRKQRDENDSIQAILKIDTIKVDTNIVFTKEEAFNCYYSKTWQKDSAEVKIAENMYLRKRWADSLYKDVKRLTVYPRKIYQYTDMNMILAAMLIDTVNDKPINEYLYKEFYETLGLRSTSYNPLKYYPKHKIAPTETERYWRNQTIWGTVHDPSAAMLGGISGNAGLFSSASDLGIIGQMWLNGGSYGGIRYLNPGTIKMFSATQPENHRGLGFDKAAIKNLNAPSAPPSTYGHTGFTGCVMWIDPENEIVYIFLSNRLHPDVKNWKILGQRVLQNVHQVIYDAMEN